MGNSMNVTSENFESEVLESDIPVVVDFWAPWCGPCRMLGPILDQVAAEFDGRVKVVKVNTDEQPELASRYSILNIPAMKFFNNGELVHEHVGLTSKDNIIKILDQYIDE